MTETVIGCAYRVANTLGPGFLEKVYENALAHEMRKSGLDVAQQRAINVIYDGIVVGQFAADLTVNDTVLVELKAGKAVDDARMAQCINYLKATGQPVCLLLNFATARINVRRILNPQLPEAWIHSADHVHFEPDTDCDPVSSPIRVHPCPSVAPSQPVAPNP